MLTPPRALAALGLGLSAAFPTLAASPPLNLRTEVQNAFSDDQPERITFHNGARHTAPLTFLDDRRPNVGQLFFLRLRRTFG